MFSESADYYDLIYGRFKDYRAESERLAEMIRDRVPGAKTILDVACGTGEHARHLRELGFTVDGVDVEPRFVELARRKNPSGRVFCQDMADLDLEDSYDAVISLFSSIGYLRTEERLRTAIERMAYHAVEGGLVVVEPWFGPGEMEDGYVAMHTAEDAEVKVCRMSRTTIEAEISRLEFEYLIGRRGGLERRSEVHELGLFSRAEMERAFHDAGLEVDYDPEGLFGRGLYLGRKDAHRDR
jgi:SAM-dependent methyltransferase